MNLHSISNHSHNYQYIYYNQLEIDLVSNYELSESIKKSLDLQQSSNVTFETEYKSGIKNCHFQRNKDNLTIRIKITMSYFIVI